MKMNRLVGVASALAALLLLDAAPGSEISICNDFKARIYVALAFEDQGNFTGAGWWTVEPNKCEPAVFPFPGGSLYYAADSDQYPAANVGTSQDHWGNKTNLFITTKRFNFDHAERNRPDTSGELFSSVSVPDEQPTKPLKITLHFLPGKSSVSFGPLASASPAPGAAAAPPSPPPPAAPTAVVPPSVSPPANEAAAAPQVVTPAQQQFVQQKIDGCVNKGDAFSLDQRIAACTAAIDSGRWSGQGLAWAYNDRGNAYAIKADYDRAIADYDQAIQHDPTYALAYNGRGVAYKEKDGDYDRAIAEYNHAIQLDPNFARAYNSRGFAYAAKGDNDRAIADYTRAIALDAKYALAYGNRGRANLFAGALPKALADFDQASELAPKDGFAALWLDIASKRSNLQSRLAAATTQVDMTKWPAPIIRLYLGQLTAEAVLAAADDPDPIVKRGKACTAIFFIGELAMLEDRKQDAARLFGSALTVCPPGFVEIGATKAELAALQEQR
jgi:tetratricopeptide (TPR) repeat protein